MSHIMRKAVYAIFEQKRRRFLAPNVMDSQVAIDGYDFIRRDRADYQDKTGGGVLVYFRNSLKCKRRPEFEISKIKIIWSQIELPNAKHFLVCTVHQMRIAAG